MVKKMLGLLIDRMSLRIYVNYEQSREEGSYSNWFTDQGARQKLLTYSPFVDYRWVKWYLCFHFISTLLQMHYLIFGNQLIPFYTDSSIVYC